MPTPGVARLVARYPRRSADSVPVAHCCCHAPPLLPCFSAAGLCLRQWRLRKRRLTPAAAATAAAVTETPAWRPHPRYFRDVPTPGDGRAPATSAMPAPPPPPPRWLCPAYSWAAGWCTSTYFLSYSAQIRYLAPHPFSVSSRTCENWSGLHRALYHARSSLLTRHNEFFGRDTSKYPQRASRSPYSTSVYERFGGKRGSWCIQQRGALRCGQSQGM